MVESVVETIVLLPSDYRIKFYNAYTRSTCFLSSLLKLNAQFHANDHYNCVIHPAYVETFDSSVEHNHCSFVDDVTL